MMKLSEAILLGRMLLKPFPGVLRDFNGGGCVLGMGCAAVSEYPQSFQDVLDLWPWLQDRLANRQVCCRDLGHCNIGQFIAHVFDYHVMGLIDRDGRQSSVRWSFEQLVDWIRSNEPVAEGEVSREVRTPDTFSSGQTLMTKSGGQ